MRRSTSEPAAPVLPGYRRSEPVRRPKLDAFTGVIDRILEEDRSAPRKQRLSTAE